MSNDAGEYDDYMGYDNNQAKIDIDNMVIKDFRVFCSSEPNTVNYIKQMKLFMNYVQSYDSSNHLISGIISKMSGKTVGIKDIATEIVDFIIHIEKNYKSFFIEYGLDSFIEILHNIKVESVGYDDKKIDDDNKINFEWATSMMINLSFRYEKCKQRVTSLSKWKVYDENQLKYIDSIFQYNNTIDTAEKSRLDKYMHQELGYTYLIDF